MKILATLVLALLTAAPHAHAQSTTTSTATTAGAQDAALGTWNATFNSSQGAIDAQLKLSRSGDKITGTISSQMGDAPVEAEVKDKTLSVWFNMQGQSGPIAIELAATLNGDTLKGTYTAGGQAAGDWSATRVKDTTATKDTTTATDTKDAKRAKDLSGEWTVSLMLDTINATPSIVLKQDGEKLTGEYTSQQYGKFPLTGTVKGSDVNFSVSMAIEGNGITAVYSGSVQPDGSLKGSVNIGDAMSGSFTATRKK